MSEYESRGSFSSFFSANLQMPPANKKQAEVAEEIISNTATQKEARTHIDKVYTSLILRMF